jgi:hypothetical protein
MLIAFFCLHFYRVDSASAAPVQNLTILDSEVSPAWVPSPPGRCTWDILHGCVLTLVLCVWTSIHTNIPASKEPLRDTLFRKARWVIVALLAPEVVVFTAFQQWLTAKALLGELRRLWAENSSKNELVCRRNPVSMKRTLFLTMGQTVPFFGRVYLQSHLCILCDNGWFCGQHRAHTQ